MESGTSDPIAHISSILSSSDPTPAALEPLLPLLRELKSNPQQLTEASAKVWIASRNEVWRLPIGESGVLAFFHDLIPETNNNRTLQLNCLRILANSCADRDANRQRVIEHPLGLKPVVELVKDEETSPIATAVVWNICNEYEPAQEASIKAGGVQAVFAVLSAVEVDDDLSYLVRLLELLLTHESGREAATPGDLATVIGLFDAEDPNAHGFDNALNMHAILSSLLSVQALQIVAVKEHMPRIIGIFEGSYELNVDEDSERKDKSLVAYARQQLTEALVSIITTHTDLFLSTHPLTSAFFSRLTQLLKIVPGKEDLTALACVLIGNVARSDELCAQLLERGVHVPLLRIITDTTASYNATITALREGMQKLNPETSGAMSVGLLHSAVGVLKNLSIAAPHKPVIASAGAFPAIRGMLDIDGVGSGQVHYSAVSFARLLVVKTPENARAILEGGEKSILRKELEIYEKSEEPPTRTEISRTIVAILREIYGTSGAPELLPQLLLLGGIVAQSLWDMVEQEKYASVKGEGWFGLALLGRGEEGAKMVGGVVELDVVRGLWGGGEERRAERENAKAVVVQMGQFGVGGEEVRKLVDEILKGEVRVPEKKGKEEGQEEKGEESKEPRVVEVRDDEA